MTLGENLRGLRESCKMTQQQAADRLGVTRQALSSYESNRTRPDIDRLQELAVLYGTDLEGIIYGTAHVLKGRKTIRILAVILLALLTAIHVVGATCLWAANRFFPLANEGSVSSLEMRERLQHHVPLSAAWEKMDSIGIVLAAAGGLLAAGLLLPGLCFGLADPVFGVINYLIMPGRDMIRFVFLFLLLLAAEAVIRRREERHL